MGEIDSVWKCAVPLLAAAIIAAAPAPAPAQVILFEGARAIPGDGSAAIENAAILVEGGLIARISHKGEIAAPPGAVRVELDGKTVMPAMISPHVHPGFQKGLTYSVENFSRENILADLNRELYFGVSTVMSLGIEKGDVMDRIRADQAAGRLGGARLLIAGRGIGAPNAGPGAALRQHRLRDHDRGPGKARGRGACRTAGRHHEDLGRRSRRPRSQVANRIGADRDRPGSRARIQGRCPHLLS
jgi:hypothetical protein